MSDYSAIKSSRLSFKGEKRKKKTKSKSHVDQSKDKVLESTADRRDLTARGWTTVVDRNDLNGPLFFLYNTAPLRCLAVTEETHKLYFSLIGEEPESVLLKEAEPQDILQVFVARQITAGGGGYTLRSATGHYLSADKFGVVTCLKEAAGPTEEWQPVLREDGIAWQSIYGKFLSIEIDENQTTTQKEADNTNKELVATTTTAALVAAAAATTATAAAPTGRGKYSGPRVRADAENITFREVFCVKHQADTANDRKRTASNKETTGIDEEAYELQQLKRFQSGSGVQLAHATHEDKRVLKKAKRQGQLAQALLDRREKTKADRYCK
ncbi:hypothetical protein BDF19DRAFT_428255 [Syncephalis fuscata]|nr:hypothetical protein BDF19DRAFT_428255 [Syncephalis fuscata]